MASVSGACAKASTESSSARKRPQMTVVFLTTTAPLEAQPLCRVVALCDDFRPRIKVTQHVFDLVQGGTEIVRDLLGEDVGIGQVGTFKLCKPVATVRRRSCRV